MKIVHLSSVHSRYDTRIFRKMCISLVSHGYDATLIVADGKGDEVSNEIQIIDVGASNGRRARILNAPRRVFERARTIDADIFHMHDPELLPIGIKLKRLGKCVIFDAHEDFPKQLLSKPYLNKTTLQILSKAASMYESWACARFDGVITATPFIREKFLKVNLTTIDINNFPILDELTGRTSWDDKSPEVCYVGGIGQLRGIREVVAAMGALVSNAHLNLCGKFGERALECQMQYETGWQRVNALGFVDRMGVRDVLARSIAGIVTFHPVPNHIEAQPNKMFEYMSAGIPVIASDFPLWREIVAGNECGLLVDPLDYRAIAEAIDTLVSDPTLAQRMGVNGRKAVEKQYNWGIEEKKLLAFYESVINRGRK